MIDWDSCVLWLDSKYFSESYWWVRSRYRNNGVVYGAKWKNNGLFFQNGGYVRIPDHPVLRYTDNYTIEVWAMSPDWDSVPEWTNIIGKRVGGISGGWDLKYGSGGNYIGLHSCYININEFVDGEVAHIVGTKDSNGNVKMYLNGVLKNSCSDRTSTPNNYDVLIGKARDAPYYEYFYGYIYVIRKFNKVLNANEVKILYNLDYIQSGV